MKDRSELFWDLLEPEYTKAAAFCRKLTGDRNTGDDLYQDALVIAFTRFTDLRDHAAFRPWLYRIVVNTFKSRMRRRRWRRQVQLPADSGYNIDSVNPGGAYAARRSLELAFRMIAVEDRALVVMHELEGWPVADLARVYGKTPGAIKARLFRIRRKMKKTLLQISRKHGTSMLGRTNGPKERQCAAVKPETE